MKTSDTEAVSWADNMRGGNWWVSPHFFLKKSDDIFSHRLWKVITFFSCRLLITPIFLRLLTSVLSEFSHKNNFSRVSPPWRVSSGAVRPLPFPATSPPSDATVRALASSQSPELSGRSGRFSCPQNGVYTATIESY